MKPYPLLFEPILKPKVWGGRTLEKLGKVLPSGETIGESWELADLPPSIEGGRSVIANGELAGQRLREAVAANANAIIGAAKLVEGGFPLLIKYLDARKNLSVQVHPPDDYVRQHPEAHLKSEAWFVVEAEPGGVIYKGVKPGVTADSFARHIEDGTVVDDLIAVPVQPGDFHYLPCGTCHALGGGIVVAEIQTPSDTTYRVFDWGRTERELHIEQALQCIDFDTSPDSPPPSPPVEKGGLRSQILCRTEHFEIERIEAIDKSRFEVVTSGMPEVWMLVAGAGHMETASGTDTRLSLGTTALIPAGLADTYLHLEPETSLLRVTLPSPLEGMIA